MRQKTEAQAMAPTAAAPIAMAAIAPAPSPPELKLSPLGERVGAGEMLLISVGEPVGDGDGDCLSESVIVGGGEMLLVSVGEPVGEGQTVCDGNAVLVKGSSHPIADHAYPPVAWTCESEIVTKFTVDEPRETPSRVPIPAALPPPMARIVEFKIKNCAN
jgi:hypothetical protein